MLTNAMTAAWDVAQNVYASNRRRRPHAGNAREPLRHIETSTVFSRNATYTLRRAAEE